METSHQPNQLQVWAGQAGAGPDPGTGEDEQDQPDPAPDAQVRLWTTNRLQTLIATLTPYIDGTFGDVSPRHGTLYLRAVGELNRLWNARYLPPPPEPEPEPEEEVRTVEQAAAVRTRVLEYLEELRNRT